MTEGFLIDGDSVRKLSDMVARLQNKVDRLEASQAAAVHHTEGESFWMVAVPIGGIPGATIDADDGSLTPGIAVCEIAVFDYGNNRAESFGITQTVLNPGAEIEFDENQLKLVKATRDNEGDYWVRDRSLSACPEGANGSDAKNALCITLGDRTVKVDVKNGELCVREVEPGSGTGTGGDECDENSLTIDVCEECTGTGTGTGTAIDLEDCPCVSAEIDAVSYGGNAMTFYAADALPVYPENNASLITTEGRVAYFASGSIHRWLWKELHGIEYKIHAAYWDEITNPIIRIINCVDDSVETVEVGQVIDGGQPSDWV